MPAGDLSVPMSAAFLAWVADRTRQPSRRPSTRCCARSAPATGAPGWLRAGSGAPTIRVSTGRRRYRNDIDVWRTDDGDGILVVGRGVCDRWELGFEVAPDARGRGLGPPARRRGACARAGGRTAVGAGRAG